MDLQIPLYHTMHCSNHHNRRCYQCIHLAIPKNPLSCWSLLGLKPSTNWMQVTKNHTGNTCYRLEKAINTCSSKLQQGRHQQTASSHTDTHHSSEQSPRLMLKTCWRGLLFFAALHFGEVDTVATPGYWNNPKSTWFEGAQSQNVTIVSASCVWELMFNSSSLHWEKAEQENIHSMERHICPLDAASSARAHTSLPS